MKLYGVYVLVDRSDDFIIVDNAGTLFNEFVVMFCPDGRALEVSLATDLKPVPDFGRVQCWWHCHEKTNVLPQIGSLVCSPSSFVMSYWKKYWKGEFNPLIQNVLTRYGVWRQDMPDPTPVPGSAHPVLWSQIACLNRQLNKSSTC